MELIYSPDDNGYYWQRFKDWAVSQLFPSEKDAIEARKNNKIEWDL